MIWQKFVFHFFEELAQPCWYLEGPKNGGWNWLPMLAVLRNQSLAYTSGFSPSKRGRKRRRPNEKFFCDSRKKWNFSPPKYSNAPLLGERESRLSDFLLRFFRQNLLSQSFLHCSLLTLSNAMVHVDYQSTQRVDSESIPWLHRSRFALVLTGAFLEIYFFNALSEKLLSSDWEHLFPLNRYGALPWKVFIFFLYDKSTKRVHFILIVYDSYTFLEVRNNHHSSESTDLTFSTYDEHAHEGDK